MNKKLYRSIFFVLLVAMAVVSLVGCAAPKAAATEAPKPESKLAVGIVLPDQRRTPLGPGRNPLQGCPDSRWLRC